MNAPLQKNPGDRILVAGIGNVFLGDDGCGVEAVRALVTRPIPDAVNVAEFGIRAYDLAFALTGGYESAILIDAVPRGDAPGTVYLIQPATEELPPLAPGAADAHAMHPLTVLQMAQAFGSLPSKLFLVGCEPAVLDNEDGRMGLSEQVNAAVPRAVEMVEQLVKRLLDSRIEKTTAGFAPA